MPPLVGSTWEQAQIYMVAILEDLASNMQDHEDRLRKLELRIAGWAFLFLLAGGGFQLAIHFMTKK
jgi:hypothetical protein